VTAATPPHDWRQAVSGTDGAVILAIRVQPGARRTRVAGPYGDRVRIAVQAPPVDGKANAALVVFIAKLVGVPRRAVHIDAGHGGRDKRVRVEAAVQQVLQPLARALGDLDRGT
jgi:hypothetical protein